MIEYTITGTSEVYRPYTGSMLARSAYAKPDGHNMMSVFGRDRRTSTVTFLSFQRDMYMYVYVFRM